MFEITPWNEDYKKLSKRIQRPALTNAPVDQPRRHWSSTGLPGGPKEVPKESHSRPKGVPQESHRGFTEVLQESNRDLIGVPQDSHRGPIGVLRDSHRGPIGVPQGSTKGVLQKSQRGPTGVPQVSHSSPGSTRPLLPSITAARTCLDKRRLLQHLQLSW